MNAYRSHLEERGLASTTVNVHLAAIRRLAAEAADDNLVDPHLAAGIGRVKGSPKRGARIGNWRSGDLSERLIQAPNPATLTGKRDRAILGLLIGCGLRRGEAAAP